MTSEEEERPRFVTGGYGRHRRQWVKVLLMEGSTESGGLLPGELNYTGLFDLKQFLNNRILQTCSVIETIRNQNI